MPSAETAAAPDESAEPAPTAETGSVDQALLSDVLMQTENFSVLLMQNLMNANTEQNSAFSPLALNAVMAALYAGAKGDTEEEMRLLMGYQTEPGDVVQALTYLISAQDSNAFTLGDSLHLSRRVGFVENYIDQITAPLRIGTYSQDYSDPATYQSVNACAEQGFHPARFDGGGRYAVFDLCVPAQRRIRSSLRPRAHADRYFRGHDRPDLRPDDGRRF